MADDPFLWLEEVEGDAALNWVRKQNDRSIDMLKGHPAYDVMHDEALAILTADDRVPSVALRAGYAYNFWQDETHVRGLYRRMSLDAYQAGGDRWEVLLDLDQIAADEKENWVFGGLTCLAPDYQRCVVKLSRGGSDAAVQREYDLETRSFVADGFALPEAKSTVAWLDRDTLLVGTDFGPDTLTASGYPRIVKRWKRGTPLVEAETLYEAPTEDIWAFPVSYYGGEAYRGGVFHGETFYDYHWLMADETGALRRLPLPPKASVAGYTGDDFIIELKEAWTFGQQTYKPASVVAFSDRTQKASLVFEPSPKTAVEALAVAPGGVMASLSDDIRGRLVRYVNDQGQWIEQDVGLPKGGVISLQTMDPTTGNAVATFEDPITPPSSFIVKAETARLVRRSPAYFDADGMVVQRFEATSSDGTLIPYTVTAHRATLDRGPAPTIQYGYGGFEVSILPHYAPLAGRLWLARGGVYVTANIRGGGEYGPAWHQAGLGNKRQLIYDDFYAVSEDLIARSITTTDQLGILGGSNGGLLVGVSMTQRPDLYKAVGIGVPLLDMLRYHLLLAGASWVGEYGDPDDPVARAFLETISPYHNLDPDTDYPRPFFFTSTKDDRVHPGHARKMARLMEEQGHPFLYFENIEGGHGAAANLKQSAHRQALQYSYFAGELGLIPHPEGEQR